MLRHPLARLLAVAVIPALIVYVVVLTLAVAAGIEPLLAIRDLMQTARKEEPIVVGMISNLGIVLWAAAAAISLFASCSGLVGQRSWRKLLLVGGLFSTILCLDDFFLLHDRHVIVHEGAYYLLYAVFAAVILVYFRKLVLQADGLAFLAAALLLGLSVFSDRFQDSLPGGYDTVQLFEEGFKFIGIACWLAFWWQASLRGATLDSNE